MTKLAQPNISGCAKREYVDAYQTIRIIATILVVIGHCSTLALPIRSGEIWVYPGCEKADAVISEIKRLIYSFHMPLFMMLSGLTFGLTFPKNGDWQWLVKRGKRLLFPYVTVILFALLPIRLLIGYYGENPEWGKILYADIFLTYDIGYLWYLIALFEINTIVFLCRKYILSQNLKRQIYSLTIILCVSVLSFLLKAVPFQLDRAVRYLFWFYLGIVLEYHRDILIKFAKTKNIIIAVAVWLVGYGLHTWLEMLLKEDASGYLFWCIKGIKMLIRYSMMEIGGSMMIVLLAFKVRKIHIKWLERIGNQAFAIYLYHCYCIWMIRKVIHILIPASMMSNVLYGCMICLTIVFGVVGAMKIDTVFTKAKKKLVGLSFNKW